MKTSFISTLSLGNAPRANLQRLQNELAQASKEVITGRRADVGLALGHDSARSVTLRHDDSALAALIDSNAGVAAHLQRSQTAVDSISGGADAFLQMLVSTPEGVGGAALLETQAKAALSAFIDLANTNDGQRFVFGGINSGAKPLADYAGAPKLALDAAFAARFGFAQDDPLAAGIDPADMADFLDTEFAALFEDPAWSADWSSASDANLASRISPSERIEISANANETAMRKLAMGYSMVAELGAAGLGQEAREALLAKATDAIGAAIADLTATRARLGTAEERVTAASGRMREEQDVLERRLAAIEGADPIEAKVKVDTLSTQIEMSYALTSRLLRLSIMNYA